MGFMWKRVPFSLAIFPFSVNHYDTPRKTDEKPSNMYLDATKDETGWDRLRSVFLSTDVTGISPELNAIYNAIFAGAFCGAVYGGIVKSSKAFNTFVNINDATKFANVREARKMLQDEVTISFLKGAYRYGWRVSLLSGSYIGLTTLIGTYRGKSSIIEYTLGGGITGMMYKIPLGPRGMISGGIVGAVLGTLAGSATLLILKMTGTTVEELRYWQRHFKNVRDTKIRESYIEAKRKEESAVFLDHDEKVKDIPVAKQLDNISEKTAQKEISREKGGQ